MTDLPQDALSFDIQRLRGEETRLESGMRAMKENLSGLVDIDMVLSLAAAKLSLCLKLIQRGSLNEDTGVEITEKALASLRLVEGLLAENISEDQKGIVQANPLYAQVSGRLQEFLMAGGGGFLEVREAEARARRLLARTIVAAVRKFNAVDDRYPPLDLESYPPFVKKVLLFLFPATVRENPEQPPYGIEEGEEVTYSSRNMKLPLSQAIHCLENDLIPEMERKLAENPGDGALQEEIRRFRDRLEDYRKLRFFPRSTPVLLEKGYYTEGMTGYTADGEMLVPVPLPVTFRSGTNLDRIMEMVRMDVVRRIAGRGVSAEIDQEYRRLRSLESGIHGSSRAPSMKLDPSWGYRVLKQEFPFVAALEDKRRFQELAAEIQDGRNPAERIEALLGQEHRPAGLPEPL